MPPIPATTVIVPAYNAAGTIQKCLAALLASTGAESEIVVVDDGSTDDTAALAEAAGVRVVRLAGNSGPGAARNRGAEQARGGVLVFVDSDVVVAPDAVGRARRTLAESDAAAVFGSYDTNPAAPGLVSQFRNLLHHWVHQQSRREAFTFWAGLGAIRRPVFEAAGGFDEGGPAAVLEDVELGHRVCAAGHRIVLDPAMLGTHLKRWTMVSMVRADLLHRAIPWGRLLLAGGDIPRDLNLTAGQRWSVALSGVVGGTLALAVWWRGLLPVAGVALGGIILLNRRFYDFLAHERGLAFALASIPVHVIHLACGGLGFAYAWLETRLGGSHRKGVRALA
jgi:hypothetical protein